jgi:heterotetrameric sarcosine oxidase beta subunit
MTSTADVVIIGGGCMGASVAYHLAKLGVTNVVLVEREAQLGTGSTGRNAGGVRHQFSTPANIALSIESIQLFERFEDVVGAPIDFHQDGYLFLLSSPTTVETFRANVTVQRQLGVSVDWLTAQEAAALAPGLAVDGVLGATFCAKDGIADPNGVTMGFARSAQALGVRIERETDVTAIHVESGRVTGVTTSRGRIDAPIVINAAGPHARAVGLMAGVDTPVDPRRRHIFIAQAPGAGIPASKIMVIDFDTTFYFHREGAGLLFGMAPTTDEPTFDMTVQWDFLPHVTETAVRRLPALADASISHAWAGLYEMTPDANPIIGPSPDVAGLFTIAGFSGHGFQHAPAAGRILADLITGRDPKFDLAPLRADHFSTGGGGREQSVV